MQNKLKSIKDFPWLAVAGALVFALTVIITKEVFNRTDGVSSVHFSASVAVSAGIFALILTIPQRREFVLAFKNDWKLILGVAIFSGALGYGLLRIGQAYTTAGNAGLLSSLTSISTIIVAYFWLKESLARRIILLLPVLFGLLAILLLDFENLTINLGDFLLFLFIICLGLSNVMATILVRIYRPNIITYSRFALGGLFLTPLLFVESNFSLWSVVVGGLTLLSVVFFYKAIKYYGPQITTIILSIYPPIIYMYGWLFLDEKISIVKVIAAAGVLATATYIGLLKNSVKTVKA